MVSAACERERAPLSSRERGREGERKRELDDRNEIEKRRSAYLGVRLDF